MRHARPLSPTEFPTEPIHDREIERPAVAPSSLAAKDRFMPTTELEAVRTTSTRTGETIPELLAEQVRFRPEDVAVVHRDRSFTYRRLADDSALVAAYLRHLGAGPDDRIGVLADPSYDLALGTWGILRAGSAYLPLSPDYPAERLRFMIEDARAAIVFVQDELRPRLRELAPADTRVVTLSDARAFGRAQGITGADDGTLPPLPSPEPHHLAYVIYTSGSTGRPKGVMIEHRSLANQLRWLHNNHGLDERRRVLQKTPTSFDAAQWELLAPACGATVVMGEPGLYRDPDRMAEHIARHRITTLQCVPTCCGRCSTSKKRHGSPRSTSSSAGVRSSPGNSPGAARRPCRTPPSSTCTGRRSAPSTPRPTPSIRPPCGRDPGRCRSAPRPPTPSI